MDTETSPNNNTVPAKRLLLLVGTFQPFCAELANRALTHVNRLVALLLPVCVICQNFSFYNKFPVSFDTEMRSCSFLICALQSLSNTASEALRIEYRLEGRSNIDEIRRHNKSLIFHVLNMFWRHL